MSGKAGLRVHMNKWMAVVCLIFLCSLVLLPFAHADWIMFHADPSHSGAGSGPASTSTLLWKFTTFSNGGCVYSSPAVVNGVVYIGALESIRVNKTFTISAGSVFALNAANGNKIWNYTTPNYPTPSDPNNVYPSPAVANGIVYVGSYDHNIFALNAANGDQIWNYTTGSAVASSPAVVNGIVYVGSNDGYVYALNAANGNRIWSYKYDPTGQIGWSSPAVVDGIVYIGYGFNGPTGAVNGSVCALDAYSGAKLWNYTTNNIIDSSPAVDNGVVYIGSNDGNVYAFGALSLATSILPASVTMDVGQSYLFNSTVIGGMSPYSYQWYLNGAPVSGATSATWTFTPSILDFYAVFVKVTDMTSATATSNTATATVNPAPSEKVAIPTFSPAGGTYISSQSVILSCSTAGSTIRYTLDGTEPNSWSTAYTGPISVSSNVTITAKAFLNGMTDSNIASATYTIISSSSSTDSGLDARSVAIVGVVVILAVAFTALYFSKIRKTSYV